MDKNIMYGINNKVRGNMRRMYRNTPTYVTYQQEPIIKVRNEQPVEWVSATTGKLYYL